MPLMFAILVSILTRPDDTSSTMLARSSAAFAASGDPPRAFLSAVTSIVFPAEGSTSILPLTLLISKRPLASSG
jgi:hypothetical protein